MDTYKYRFITWNEDDPALTDDDDVIFLDKKDKWDASPVPGCKSHREYRSGSQHDPTDLRYRAQPCSCPPCGRHEFDLCCYEGWAGAQTDAPGGWARITMMIKPRSGASPKSKASVVSEGLDAKDARLSELAPHIKEGDVVAFGVAESERRAQNVDFYFAKVLEAPRRATRTFRNGPEGRSGWNIKKGEFYLKVRWYKETRPGVLVDEEWEENQLLEMVVCVGVRAATLELENATTTPSTRSRRRRGTPTPTFKLTDASKEALENQNITKYVDRAAPGSSA